MTTDEIIRIDSTALDLLLRTIYRADFYLVEDDSGFTMEVITRTKGGAKMGHYALDQVRGNGPKVWKHLDVATKFIKTQIQTHKDLNVSGVMVLFCDRGPADRSLIGKN